MAKFVISPKGLFERYENDLFRGTLEVKFPIAFHKEIDTFEVVETELEQELELIFTRMPLSVFQQALAFFRAVWNKHHTEAVMLQRYIDGTWENFVPMQWCSRTSACYHPELTPKEATRVVMDTHLHPPEDKKSTSFHSSTDHADEKKNEGLFVVVSGFSPFSCYPDIVGVVRGKRFTLNFEQVVDPSKYDPKPSFPPEWLERVKTSLPCDGCKPATAVTTSTTVILAEDKGKRLVPEDVVKKWREKRVAEKKKTNGQRLQDIYTSWRAKVHDSTLFQCDNSGCRKFYDMAVCPHCNKKILQQATLDGVALMVDEIDCHREMAVEKTETPSTTVSQPAATTASPQPTSSEKSEGDLLLVHTKEACDEKCPYKAVPHGHVAEESVLEKIFKDMSTPTVKTVVCKSSKGCHCPSKCKEKCALEGLDPKDWPICTAPACEREGHTWAACEVRKFRERMEGPKKEDHDTKKMLADVKYHIYCGDPECERLDHIILTCAAMKLEKEGKSLPLVISTTRTTCHAQCSFKGRPHMHCEYHDSLIPLIESATEAQLG